MQSLEKKYDAVGREKAVRREVEARRLEMGLAPLVAVGRGKAVEKAKL